MGLWQNEDDDAWVEVAMEPDRDRAGQRLADLSDMIQVFVGRTKIATQDCECVPTHAPEGHAQRETVLTDQRATLALAPVPCGDHPGAACVTHENVDVWHFEAWDEADATPEVIAEIYRSNRRWNERKNPIYSPTVAPASLVAPGQIEVGL